jgi:twitching motility protein PilT
MPAVYNDYVLSTALEHGLISGEQHQSVAAMLTANPGLSALEFLYEQQMLNDAQRDWFYQALHHAQETAPAEAHPEAHAEAHPVAEPAPAPAQAQAAAPRIQVVASSHSPGGPFRHVHDYLQNGIQLGASDVHLGPDAAPLVRLGGRLLAVPEGAGKLTKAESEALARGFLTEKQAARVADEGSLDFCYEIPGVARFRTSVVRQRRGWEMVFRIINSKVPTMDGLALPESLRTLTRYHNGLVLVTGSVGSGKSTTLAAMVEQINRDRHDHIITLEDPVEYVFEGKGCQVSQREVHSHTESFGAALRAALREDPDVIMVGEMRDLETISLAITASETGHLVLGTLHTSTAPRTLDRLLDVFPISQQAQIRTMVSESIRGIVCQQLVPRADGQGRVLALEVMMNNPAVGALIRDGKTFMLPGVIQTGRKQGMKLMDDSLLELLDQNLITPDEAYNRAENKKFFAQEMARRQREQ